MPDNNHGGAPGLQLSLGKAAVVDLPTSSAAVGDRRKGITQLSIAFNVIEMQLGLTPNHCRYISTIQHVTVVAERVSTSA